MDFEDQDEAEEEMELPVVVSRCDTPMLNLAHAGGGGPKMGGNAGGAGETAVPGSGKRKAGDGEGGGGGGRYRECLKNHAVGIGGHAVDGCGEFLAAGEAGTLDALRCAACNCHRNFHRKEVERVAPEPVGYQHHFAPFYRTPAEYLHHHHQQTPHLLQYMVAAQQQEHRPPPPPALPSTSGHDQDDDESNPMTGSAAGQKMKRFRTKFTQEQKEKMQAFAERVAWRIQKHDKAAVQQFCEETCVKRHVLKVWMHNNKHSFSKNH